MIESIARFLNGAYPFAGSGYDNPTALHPALAYTVPADRRSQFIYLRAGNSTAEMIYLSLMQDGAAVRLFPIGAKASVHVPLAVIEDLEPGTKIELLLAAPEGIAGTVVVDVGILEI